MKNVKLLSVPIALVLVLAGCNQSVSYKPINLPFKITVDRQGQISLSVDGSIITSVGEFSIESSYNVASSKDDLLLIIRDRRKSSESMDTIYRIHTGEEEIVAVLDGTTVLEINKRRIVVDVSSGVVRNIEFRQGHKHSTTSNNSGAKHPIVGSWGNDAIIVGRDEIWEFTEDGRIKVRSKLTNMTFGEVAKYEFIDAQHIKLTPSSLGIINPASWIRSGEYEFSVTGNVLKLNKGATSENAFTFTRR